jgi:hypothetical protein
LDGAAPERKDDPAGDLALLSAPGVSMAEPEVQWRLECGKW